MKKFIVFFIFTNFVFSTMAYANPSESILALERVFDHMNQVQRELVRAEVYYNQVIEDSIDEVELSNASVEILEIRRELALLESTRRNLENRSNPKFNGPSILMLANAVLVGYRMSGYLKNDVELIKLSTALDIEIQRSK